MNAGAVNIEVQDIPDENVGYAVGTLRAMQRMVAKGIEDPGVRAIAAQLKGRTIDETLQNDWKFLKRRIQYKPDPVDMESVMSARFTVGHGAPGDCDDMAVAVATILHLQRIHCHFEAVEWRTDAYTHVIAVADTPSGPVPFDLTMNALGEEHEPTKLLPFPIMAQVRTIDDSVDDYVIEDDGPTIIEDLVRRLQGPNYDDRILAYNALHLMYPQQMTAYVQRLARESALRGGMNDMWSTGAGWLGSILTAGLVPSDVITGAIDSLSGVLGSGTIATAVGGIVLGAKKPTGDGYYEGDVHRDSDRDPKIKQGMIRPVQMSLANNYDETHPGRTVTSPVTFLEEVMQIYATSYPPKGNATIPNNYSAVIIPYEQPNVPVWGPLKKINRGLVIVSFDDLTGMMSDYLYVIPTRVGNGYELTGVKDSGVQEDFPGYYTCTVFGYAGDGVEKKTFRYDFVGMTPADIPTGSNPEKQPDFQKSTAYSYLNAAMYSNAVRHDVGTDIPTTTPSHVQITSGGGGGIQQPVPKQSGGSGAQPPKQSGGIVVQPTSGGGYQITPPTDTGGLLATLGGLLSAGSIVPKDGYTIEGKEQPLKNPETNYTPWIIGGGVLVGGVLIMSLLKK